MLSWLQASSVPRLWFLHHLSPLQGSERPPPPSHLPDPTKALVSLLIMKEKVRRIRVIPPPGERLTSEKLPATQYSLTRKARIPLWGGVLVQRLGLSSGQEGHRGTLTACLIPTQAFSEHPSLPSLLSNVSRRQASSPPKSTWNLTMSPHFCCPFCSGPSWGSPLTRSKSQILAMACLPAHPGPSLTSSPHTCFAPGTLASLLLLGAASHVLPQGLCTCCSHGLKLFPEILTWPQPNFLQTLWHHFLKETFLPQPTDMEATPSGILAPTTCA